MAFNPPSRARTTVIRQPRQGERQPSEPRIAPERHPHRVFGSIYALLFGFILLIVVGGVLLALPVSQSEGAFTPLDTSFFTAVSAVTVTGHIVVNTPTYWSGFGQAVIFFLMLVGGLSFMAVSTFLLALIGLSPSLSERLVVRESIGADKMAGLTHVTRNIILVVVLFYLIGAGVIFASIRGWTAWMPARRCGSRSFFRCPHSTTPDFPSCRRTPSAAGWPACPPTGS